MTHTQFALERNGPTIAAEMIALAVPAKFTVVTIAYNRANCRAFTANTLRQAFRLLGSVCNSSRGKLHRKGEFAACVVTPAAQGSRVMNWTECKRELGIGQPVR